MSLLADHPSNVGRTVLTQQFPRLVDPGPVLARFLERFFPGLLVLTQPLNQVGYTWTVYYNFDQYLWSPAGAPDRGIGVFFRFGASDWRGEPHQIRLQRRDRRQGSLVLAAVRQLRDRLGAHGDQPQLRSAPASAAPAGSLVYGDAIELYYNAAITPWFNAALDLQIIDQALERRLNASGSQIRDMNTAVVLGLRVYARF